MQYYVTGINCDPSAAHKQMIQTKLQFQKRTAFLPSTATNPLHQGKQLPKQPMLSALSWRRSFGAGVLRLSFPPIWTNTSA